MLKNILKLKGAQELSKNEQAIILGGVSRTEYCETLGCMLDTHFATGGDSGYQGDISYGMDTFAKNCGAYGYTIN